MVKQYNYESGSKIRIWQDEFPPFDLRPIKTIEKEFHSTNENLEMSKLMVVELSLPKNVSNYAMLGVQYEICEKAKIEINVFDYDTIEFTDNLGLKPDYIQLGLPEDYIEGIFRGIDNLVKLGSLKKGKYRFFIGAHGEVGSSINMFDYICRVLVELLYEKEINKESVEKAIKKAL
jgi:hypothetical protein